MNPSDFDAFDRMIDGALREEPMRAVPFGFQRRVEERVRVVRLLQRQRGHFRRCFAVAGTVMLALSVICGAVTFLIKWPSAVLGSMPGGMGMVDYMMAQITLWGPGVAGGAIVTTGALAVVLIVVEMRPRRRLISY